MKTYDIAAYIWPSYTGKELRARQFWEQGIGEWQSVLSAEKRTPEQILPRKPLWGTVDEADPKVMEFQIKEALRHGVNVFIYDWYWYDRRPFLEQCLDEGFLGAANNEDMRFYLMWANHDAGYTWDKRQSALDEIIWLGAQPRSEFDRICRRVIDLYFKRPNYYKINGCPVFMIYEMSNFVRGLGSVDAAREALDHFRQLTKEAGFPGLHLQATIYSEGAVNVSGVDAAREGSTKDLVRLLGFDSVTHYQFCHFVDCNRDYLEILPDVQKEWERIRADYDVPYYPHATVGWDNNPRHHFLTLPIMKNNTPENFKRCLVMAKEYADRCNDVPLITINSWNEWTEMSYLEPDDVYGYGYLEAVREVFLPQSAPAEEETA
ncbi:MAG: glycoside hydrolase family 99-like domain-containing protein [Clostridia bacterium]|nr:glycoside hydrolase family 99-like domain-containing protein [Clostridia bacterium]